MKEILGWVPIIWMTRAMIILVMTGVSVSTGLHLARLLRPKNVWRLVTAELPKFESGGGSMTLLVEELEANEMLETTWNREIHALERRLATLEEQVKDLTAFGMKAMRGAKPEEN